MFEELNELMSWFVFITYCGMWLHEGTHYLAARPWTSDHRFVMKYLILPVSINYEEAEISRKVARISGAAPLVVLPFTGVIFFYVKALNGLPFAMIACFGLFIVSFPNSRADIRSIRSPEEWMDS